MTLAYLDVLNPVEGNYHRFSPVKARTIGNIKLPQRDTFDLTFSDDQPGYEYRQQ